MKYKFRRATEFIVIHCSATPGSSDIGVEEIRRWHVEERGFEDIGYHYVIRRDGVIELGRPVMAIGAHVKGNNYNSVGICMVGGLDDRGRPKSNFTEAQWASLFFLVRTLHRIFPTAIVRGHRDFSPDTNHDGVITPDEWFKACPTFDVDKWWSFNKG